MDDKALKDLTPLERADFTEQIKANYTPEQWQDFSHFMGGLVDAVKWWTDRAAHEERAPLSAFLAAFIEEMESDPVIAETPTKELSSDDFLDSDAFKAIVARAIARLEAERGANAVPALLSGGFLPMLNGAPVNGIMRINTKAMRPDNFTKKASVMTGEGQKITIENFDKLQGTLSAPAQKILHVALSFLTSVNFYKSNRRSITPTVEIPLIEYGEACGYQLKEQPRATPAEQEAERRRVNERVKDLKKNIRRDLHDLASVLWSGEETRGRNKGDYTEMRIISSHSISRGIIRINFDVDAAAYLVNAYAMWYPLALLKHDNRRPTAYAIGYKIAFHNSNDRNNAAGTENTLSVKSLLSASPEIPSIDSLQARGQRNWKDKIKRPLETALNDNVNVGYLSRWEYRDPRTGKTYTPDTAQGLTWTQYTALMVDYVVIDPPDQTERRAAKAEAARQAAQEKGEQPKKRGRPKKRGVSEEQKGG